MVFCFCFGLLDLVAKLLTLYVCWFFFGRQLTLYVFECPEAIFSCPFFNLNIGARTVSDRKWPVCQLDL